MVSNRLNAKEDQAAGLRRLFDRPPNQVVAFASGRPSSGLTSLLVQTAVALAEAGHRVMLVDENTGPGCALANLGVRAPGDLWDSMMGRKALENLIVSVAPNLWAVCGHQMAVSLHQDAPAIREKLAMLVEPIRGGCDYILIDSHLSPRGHLSLLSSTAYHMVVVVGAETVSIKDSYTLIKRLVQERGRDGFQVVVTRPDSAASGQQVFDNLKRTAGAHLGVRLNLLGVIRIPTAENVAGALATKLPFQPAAQIG